MATVTLTRGITLPDSAGKADFHNLVDSSTGAISAIVNADIDAAAAIANSKLNLASIAQNVVLAGTVGLSGVVTVNSKTVKLAKGADVASAAGAITLGEDGNYFDITGTEAITSITAKAAGTVVVLQFDSTATLTDGSNLKLNSNFTGAAEAQIMLVSDGTNWLEVSRSVGQTVYASVAEVKTGTEAAKCVAPSTMIGHEGVVKAWAEINGTGTPAIIDSFNVSGIVDTATGRITVSWETDFAGTSYAVLCSHLYNTTAAAGTCTYNNKAAGSIEILTGDNGGSLTDHASVSVVAIGDR
jgi:hypothetical protein